MKARRRTPTPLRVALYTRVSTGDQDAGNQVDQLREFAAKQGWTVTQEFKDVASGGRGDRRAFQNLMAAASQRRFDLVLFWSLDRFSREGVGTTLRHLQLLESWGVGFRSFTEPYLDSLGVFKDAILALLATLAKQERIRISERTRAGMKRARRRGKRIGRPRLAVDLVKQVRRLRRQGLSFPAIARRLKIGVGSAHRLAAL
jgi:DNA invertase Pin-like site-specific DNA recombinase